MPDVEGRTGRTGGDETRRRSKAKKTKITAAATGPLTAVDVMTRDVITVHPETTTGELSELFQVNSIHSAPVVDDRGCLVGVISESDLVFGQMGFTDSELELLEADETIPADAPPPARQVREIMSSHPVTVEETTTVREICRLMWRLRIHSAPVLSGERVAGIVTTVDICRLIAEGRARLERVD